MGAGSKTMAGGFQAGLEREDRVFRLRTYSRYVNIILFVFMLIGILQSVRESGPTGAPFHLDFSAVLLPLLYFLVIFNIAIVAMDALELLWQPDPKIRVWRCEDFLSNARPIAAVALIIGILFVNPVVVGVLEDLGTSAGDERVEDNSSYRVNFAPSDPLEFSFVGPVSVQSDREVTVMVVRERDFQRLEDAGFCVTDPEANRTLIWLSEYTRSAAITLDSPRMYREQLALVIFNPGNTSASVHYEVRNELSRAMFGNLVFFSLLFFAYNLAWALTLVILKRRYVSDFVKREQLRLMRNYTIEEVFLIYKDGRLIVHNTRRLKPDMDKDVLTGMLTAVQNFVKDSFSEESGHLNELKYGNLKILMENGPRANLAVVLSGVEPPTLRHNMRTLLSGIHDRYMHILDDWDGDTGTLRVLKRHVGMLIPEEKQRLRGVIEEILLLYRDNRFMMHLSQRGQPDVDDTLLAQYLEEVRRRVGESTSSLQTASISEIPYGNWKILLEYGPVCYLAVLVSGPEPPDLRGRMRQALEDITEGFENVLVSWDGTTQRLLDVKAILDSLFAESLDKKKKK
ncbi:MAG: hypothetical protein FJ149_00195 [Euryarchaeota archaeon]|nr:hypothetical protein [Euryarchaeota archaeon]